MARRRKNEFRPDTARSDILGKLLLTQRQRQRFARWFLFSAVCLLALLVQDVIMSQVSIFGSTTDLVPCCILAICILQGGENGCVFALISSVVYYLSGSSPGALCIPALTFLGILGAIFRQAYLRQGFFTLLLCLTITLILYELATFGMVLFLGYTTASRLGSFMVTAGVTLATVPILYPVLLSIGKIGGETWKE